MPCYIRMKRAFLQGLLWLYLLGFGFMALSLEPGYLDFDNLPDTNFSCVGKVIGGYYADLETNCQMFHVCTIGQLDEPMDIRFLCLNGTVFDQETRVCERIDEVDCSKSEQFYSLNLELYGNTQPATLEESPETEQPLIIKSTTTTTTTTTTQAPQTTQAAFYTTATTPRTTTPGPQVISTHHFPVVNSPDIRFNPEEINISLHPGAPPDIRTKPVTYHQHGYSDDKNVVVTAHSDNSDNTRVVVTTHAPLFGDEKVLPPQEQGFIERPQVQVQGRQKTPYPHGGDSKNFNRPTPGDINFGYTYHQTEPGDDYRTEEPQGYHFHSDYRPSQDYSGHRHHHNPHTHQFKSSTFHDDYATTTSKPNNFQQKAPTTQENFFLQSLTPPAPNQHHHYNQHRTDKPQRLQLPLPLLPTLPPLTFSSPAPFALQRHIETKRYTKDHPAPPRIIISASASVSDASGRRLNYSLGTIGAAEILEDPPSSYDEYKEADVGLDPFYHDVPKIKRSRRRKREIGLQLRPKDVIKNEKEAETVLKFLVDWYEDNRRTITSDPTIDKMIDDSRAKRQIENKIKHSDIIRNEQEAIDVLRFLLEWYRDNEKATTLPTVPTSTTAKEEITPITKRDPIKSEYDDDLRFKTSDLFNRNSKFSIIGRESNVDDRSNKVNDKVSISLGDEDYVNDNFEPITYNEKYGKLKHSFKSPEKKYVGKSGDLDDNIEPIYYKDRKKPQEKDRFVEYDQPAADSNRIIGQIYHDIKELNNALLDTKTGESKVQVLSSDDDNNINRITGQINHDIKELNDALLAPNTSKKEASTGIDIKPPIVNKAKIPVNHESKELNDALIAATIEESKETTPSGSGGDIKTNSINNGNANQLNSDFRDIFLTPQFDATTINLVSTEMTLPNVIRSRGGRRRGQPRIVNITVRSKGKKNVVIEKITEKAHTAKDDFNYLRTLYKVLSTTPMNNISEEASPYVKSWKTSNDSPEDKDIFAQSINDDSNDSEEDKTQSESQNVPIVTTEQTTTTSTVPAKRPTRRRGRVRDQPPTTRKRPERSRKRVTTLGPAKEIDTTTVTSGETVKTTQSLATVDPRAINGLEDEQGEENDTISTTYNFDPSTEIPETSTITPTVTTGTDLDTQTAFFNELTQNYKKLFGVLTSTVPNDAQPTTTFDAIKILGPHLVTTEPFSAWRRVFLSTESPSFTTTSPLETLRDATQSPTTVYFDSGQFRKRSGNIDSVKYSTLSGDDGVGWAAATIPTTLSDLYKEVNIEAVDGKILLQTIKNEESTTESYTKAEEKKDPTTTSGSFETSTTEIVSTTRVGKTGLLKEDDDDDDESEPGKTTEAPNEHVLEENRHFLSSFTQSFSFTEEMDKDAPIIHESAILTQEVHEGEFPMTILEETTTTQPTTVDTDTETYFGTDVDYGTTTENTVATTMEALETTTHRGRVSTTTDSQLSTTTDMKDTLKDLVEEIEDMTNSKIGDTTMEFMTEKQQRSKDGTTTVQPTTSRVNDEPVTQEGGFSSYPDGTPTNLDGWTTNSHVETTEQPMTVVKTTVPTTTKTTTIEDKDTTEISAEAPTTTSQQPSTTEEATTTEKRGRGVLRRGGRRGTRPTVRRNPVGSQRGLGRHRFSTETFTSRPEGRKQTIEEEIIDEIAKTSQQPTTTESLRPGRRRLRKRKRIHPAESSSTDAPLQRSVSATRAAGARRALPTTPLSQPDTKHHIFNCFGKAMDKFYPDSRDCRLFHYCTQGYSKNQLLDMKFVCDQNTYFDNEKLICTKQKPRRCL